MKKLILFLLMLFNFSSKLFSQSISLIWQTNPTWQSDWIHEILNGINLNDIEDYNFKVFKNNSIIIIEPGKDSQNNIYLNKLNNLKYKFGVIVLGDEKYTASDDYLEIAQFVFRNYWHKKFANHKNVVCFPVGYRNNFWQDKDKFTTELTQSRKYIWSFAGQITQKPTRLSMIQNLKKLSSKDYFIHETHSFGDSKGLSITEYRDLMLQTVFIPAPTGWWNLDTIRIYEALEAGCIPIVEKQPLDYFTNFLGSNPFITINTWDQAPKIMEQLLNNQELLKQRQKTCTTWWQTYKQNLNQHLVKIVKNTLSTQLPV